MNCNCKYKHNDRIGLYIMVFIAMMAACDSNKKLKEMQEKLDKIEVKK